MRKTKTTHSDYSIGYEAGYNGGYEKGVKETAERLSTARAELQLKLDEAKLKQLNARCQAVFELCKAVQQIANF